MSRSALVVDDSRAQRSMLKRIVTPQGDSAAGALRLIQQRLKE